MLSKAKLNFVVDAMILVAFLAAAVSGIVLLAMRHGGFQGGRNPNFGQTVLLLSRDGWNDVHVWGSLAMIAGILVHLALRWRWIVCMAKRLTASGERGAALGRAQPVPIVVTDLDNLEARPSSPRRWILAQPARNSGSGLLLYPGRRQAPLPRGTALVPTGWKVGPEARHAATRCAEQLRVV